MYDSMYGGWLVGKARQQYLVEYVGTWCRWRSGLARLIEYTVVCGFEV